MSQISDKSAAISYVPVFTSFGPSSLGALYSHFLSGETELGVGCAVVSGDGPLEGLSAATGSSSAARTGRPQLTMHTTTIATKVKTLSLLGVNPRSFIDVVEAGKFPAAFGLFKD